MKVKDLIKYLQQEGINKNAIVWLGTDFTYWDFSGINTDDKGDIVLDVAGGDKEA
ncbi:hypothetical protein LCGC14_1315650 [marine sediment metagenome]|uniref:Uncharacterized protein n=1 Tax=marine sediment metagenome TaxID=412755 RepID=A0A0F9KLK3_9ZZZZ